tara:strand:+ start:2308 stop:2826 length:519 start_codon:yes stop_codon:yes gene_type:complete
MDLGAHDDKLVNQASGSGRMMAITTKRRVPAVEGLFTMGGEPQLIGGRLLDTGGYCFPRDLGGADPSCPSSGVEEVLLTRRGRIWSFTNSAYPPPPPFVVTEPYVPVVVAAVELDVERMVVLGQVVPDFAVGDLEVGMEVELELGVLYEDEETEYLTWQWRPVLGESATGVN